MAEPVWRALRPLTIRLVAGYRPASAVSARNTATVVTDFLSWVWTLTARPDPSSPPSAGELLASPLVELYANRASSGLAGADTPAATVSTARSVLRRAVNSLDADYEPASIAHTQIQPPYSPAECAWFAELAIAQPTVTKTRKACFLVGLILGGGLTCSDLRFVRGCDIGEHRDAAGDTYLGVHVPEGRVRTVPIRRAYEPLVRRALALRGQQPPDSLLLARSTTSKNVTLDVRRRMKTAQLGQTVDMSPYRLRTTWLFACMNTEVPLPALLQLAGLSSARTLTDLVDLCPPQDPAAVACIVTGLADLPVPDQGRRAAR